MDLGPLICTYERIDAVMDALARALPTPQPTPAYGERAARPSVQIPAPRYPAVHSR